MWEPEAEVKQVWLAWGGGGLPPQRSSVESYSCRGALLLVGRSWGAVVCVETA